MVFHAKVDDRISRIHFLITGSIKSILEETWLAPTRIIDSHTGGEPTRVIVSGGPDLGSGDMAQRRDRFRL